MGSDRDRDRDIKRNRDRYGDGNGNGNGDIYKGQQEEAKEEGDQRQENERLNQKMDMEIVAEDDNDKGKIGRMEEERWEENEAREIVETKDQMEGVFKGRNNK